MSEAHLETLSKWLASHSCSRASYSVARSARRSRLEAGQTLVSVTSGQSEALAGSRTARLPR